LIIRLVHKSIEYSQIKKCKKNMRKKENLIEKKIRPFWFHLINLNGKCVSNSNFYRLSFCFFATL